MLSLSKVAVFRSSDIHRFLSASSHVYLSIMTRFWAKKMNQQSRYDTTNIASRERFEYWREAVCNSYVHLGCEAENRQEFNGLIEVSRYSNLSISRVSGGTHRVERRRCDIGLDSDSFFLLSLQTAETSRLAQFGKSTTLRAGDMGLYSSVEPYVLELNGDFSQTVVQLPADKLLERLPNAELMTARNISGQSGIGLLVRNNILAFSDLAQSANPTLQALIQDTLIDLIATGLASDDKADVELSSPEQHVMLRAKSFIREHLGDPELDRNLVAEQVGMSVRRLNDIFSKEGNSISAYIRTIRLQGVASNFKDCRFDNQTISEIAFRFGFSNMQNFSTLFKSQFGKSPRDFRREN